MPSWNSPIPTVFPSTTTVKLGFKWVTCHFQQQGVNCYLLSQYWSINLNYLSSNGFLLRARAEEPCNTLISFLLTPGDKEHNESLSS